MANHKSALKRVRQSSTRRVRNRYYGKTMRNAVRDFRVLTDAAEAQSKLPELNSLLDRMASKGRIHRNKAANLKSSLAQHVNALAV
ncbi:30S ribosomal protein S20 [Porphyromonas levii]|uniref:30S ribosomal protein S20 n=1 Tax=Porphyromonas levii TaxID=28114 RepID=UPI001B8A9194|nr:30S ribosomal protein S20 [Porphyromonas levii]MBR8759573.1 30S ribosomal protein S20 [Porphyromonas levii]